MSNLTKIPGTACSGTVCDCSVTAYWFVKTVLELDERVCFDEASSFEEGDSAGLMRSRWRASVV